MNKKRVLFFCPFGNWLVHNQVDAVLAVALRKRDCEVLIVLCDGVYQNCSVTASARRRGLGTTKTCRGCADKGESFFNEFQLPCIQLRDFIDPEDYELSNQWLSSIPASEYANANYNNLPIGRWVTPSVNSHFRISNLKAFDSAEVRKIHQTYLQDGLVTYKAIERLLNDFQPHQVCLYNARAAAYRVAFEASRNLGINVLVHEKWGVDDTFMFLQNASCLSTKSQRDFVQQWRDIPLNLSELQRVKEYFSSREQGKDLNWKGFFDFKTEYTDVRSLLEIPEQAKIFTVFTSSADELVTSEDYRGAESQLETIDQFIHAFSNRDEYLVIRHHPWIGGSKTQIPNVDFLTKAYLQARNIPSNVRIIMPGEKITSYSLIWNSSAVFTFFSTVALEAASRGVPVAVLSSSPHSLGLPYSINPNSDSATLDKLINELLEADQSLGKDYFRYLYRYASAYFFRFGFTFKSFGIKDFHFPDIRFKCESELDPAHDPALDRVCNHIIDNTPLYINPTDVQKSRLLEEEEYFLDQVFREMRDFREKVISSALQKKPVVVPPVGVICLKYTTYKDSRHDYLSGWLKQSRYQNFDNFIDIEVEWDELNSNCDDYIKLAQKILDVVKNSTAEYYLVSTSYMQYEEALLPSVLSILNSAESVYKGVWFGSWLNDPQFGIKTSIFTDAHPADVYEDAFELNPFIQNPFNLLPHFFLHRQLLIHSMELICGQVKCNSIGVSETLFKHFLESEVYKARWPVAVVHYTSELKVVAIQLRNQRMKDVIQVKEIRNQEIDLRLRLLQKEMASTQLRIESLENELKDLKEQNGSLKNKLSVSKEKIKTLRRAKAKLQEEKLRGSWRDQESDSRAIECSDSSLKSLLTNWFRSIWIRCLSFFHSVNKLRR